LAVSGTSADDCEPVHSGSNILLYALLGAGFFTLGIGGIGFIMHQRRKPLNNASVLSAHLLKGEPTELSYGNDHIIEYSDYIPSELMIASSNLTIGNVLGGGAMGVVKAGKIGNSQSVAIKQVHRLRISTDVAAWWRECEILTRVRHPNCVAFYGFSCDDTFFMFIQELCSGGNLRDACSTNPEIVEGRAIEFMLQIASGVEYLHNANIIHRDIKVFRFLFC
jgi:serine/threonine protein kinase